MAMAIKEGQGVAQKYLQAHAEAGAIEQGPAGLLRVAGQPQAPLHLGLFRHLRGHGSGGGLAVALNRGSQPLAFSTSTTSKSMSEPRAWAALAITRRRSSGLKGLAMKSKAPFSMASRARDIMA